MNKKTPEITTEFINLQSDFGFKRAFGTKHLFDSAESMQMSAEDAVLYSRSLAHLREFRIGLDYSYEAARE